MADKRGTFTTIKSCTFSVYTTLNGATAGPTKTAALEARPKHCLKCWPDQNWQQCQQKMAPRRPQEHSRAQPPGALPAHSWGKECPAVPLESQLAPLPPVLAGWAEGSDWAGTEGNWEITLSASWVALPPQGNHIRAAHLGKYLLGI